MALCFGLCSLLAPPHLLGLMHLLLDQEQDRDPDCELSIQKSRNESKNNSIYAWKIRTQ